MELVSDLACDILLRLSDFPKSTIKRPVNTAKMMFECESKTGYPSTYYGEDTLD
jgi:hypothetical protein